jgi:hypothetical protein
MKPMTYNWLVWQYSGDLANHINGRIGRGNVAIPLCQVLKL